MWHTTTLYADSELTLREAVTVANANTGCDNTINFDAALNGQTITLNDTVSSGDYGALRLDANINIVGPGSGLLTVSKYRVTYYRAQYVFR